MEANLIISEPTINNTKILDFSIQIQTAENKNIKLFYILYHIAIGVLKIPESELALNLPKFTLQLKNWKPLPWMSVQKNEESLKTTFKEGIKKVVAIRSRIEKWKKFIEQTNKKIDTDLLQASTCLKKLVEIQEEYKPLRSEIDRIINEEIPPINAVLEKRIKRDEKEYIASKESKELIERLYDISLEKFEEHFKYVRMNTELFKVCLESIENEAANIDTAQKKFISFKSDFKALYKRITESKSEPGYFESWFSSTPEDNSDPLNDIDIKTVHSIDWNPISTEEKVVQTQEKMEEPELEIDIEGSPIYQYITTAVANNDSQDYPREIRDLISAIINVGGREEYKLFHASSDHLEAYQQILLWEPIPVTTKKGEILALIDKGNDLLGKMKKIEDETSDEKNFIFRVMSTDGHVKCRDTLEKNEQKPLEAHLHAQELSQDLIGSSVPVYRLSVLRLSQEYFAKLSEEYYEPLLEMMPSIQEQLHDHVDFESKKKVTDEVVELIASLFEINEKLNIWNHLDSRIESRDSNIIKTLDEDLRTKFEEMKKMVKNYKKCFNESLCTILGVDSWWEKKRMSPIDKPNILKLENVAAFIEKERLRVELIKAQTQKNDDSEEGSI